MKPKREKYLKSKEIQEEIQETISKGKSLAEQYNYNVYTTSKEANNRAKFSQLIKENMQYILNRHPDYLTTAEYATLNKLICMTNKYYNKIVNHEKRTGYGYKSNAQNANITEIANFIGESRSNLSKKISSLKKKGFIFEDKNQIIEDDKHRKTNAVALFINPEICYTGDRNNIYGELCRFIKENDILESNNIKLPWKCWIDQNGKNGVLYKRNTYNKKLKEESNNMS